MNKVWKIKQRQVLIVGFFLSLLLSILSCVRMERRQLDAVELMLESNPAKTDTMLSEMSIPSGKQERAWYAVLKTQADYKQYKPILSDSLILTATKYYGTRHKNYRSAMAWYTQGCVYVELNDDVGATESFLHALDLFPDTLNRYYILTEKSLADVYLRKTVYDQALSMYSICRDNASTINDSTIISYCDYKIASIYLFEENYDLAEQLFARLKDEQNLSSFYRNESQLNYSKILLYGKEDFDAVLSLLNKYTKETNRQQGLAYSLLGVVHYKLCNFDSAYFYFNLSLETEQNIYTRSVDYSYLLELSCLKSDPQSAHAYSGQYTHLMDSILILENANEVVATKILYNQEKYGQKKKEYIVRVLSISATAVLLLFLMVAIIFQRKTNKYQEYYIKLIDKYRQRKIKLKDNSSESEIIDYCLRLFATTPSYYIINHDEELITSESRKAIIHDLSVSFSEYYSFARNTYPGLNTMYINYCILNYLKVSHGRVIDILCISENNYRVCKSRIRKILDSSNVLYPK